MSDFARRTLTHWSAPTVLAVLLALLSLPLVAISLDAVQAPPGVDQTSRGGVFSGMQCHFADLPAADLGRWSGAAGAVLAGALVAGTIGGRIVRRHAKLGGILTVLLAWEVAIVTLPLLPSLLHLDVDFAYHGISFDGCTAWIRSSDPSSGLQLAAGLVYLPISPFIELVPFALLLMGVVVWTVLLRRFRVTGSETAPGIRVDIPSPVDDQGFGTSE